MKNTNWKKHMYISWILIGIGNIERYISKYSNAMYSSRLRWYYIVSGSLMFLIGLKLYFEIRKEEKNKKIIKNRHKKCR